MPDAVLHLIVSGRVQGVGFRWFVAAEARRLGIAGWVKNRSDGTVEICAGGASSELISFETIVRRGPDGARVESVRSIEGTVPALQSPFSIARD